MTKNSIRRVLTLIPLTIGLSACNNPSHNQNLTQSNANTTAKVNATATTIPYLTPPMPRGSKATPTAIEVAQVLKRANIFPKDNAVREEPLSDLDKTEGALTRVLIESSRLEGVTVKVYKSIDQRNQARLRMIKECPGCNFIVECDSILMYEPLYDNRELNVQGHKLTRERYEVLKRYFGCG
jgi:hypothetical protein